MLFSMIVKSELFLRFAVVFGDPLKTFIIPSLMTMKRQWTYGPTQVPLNDHFHTSLACFTAL